RPARLPAQCGGRALADGAALSVTKSAYAAGQALQLPWRGGMQFSPLPIPAAKPPSCAAGVFSSLAIPRLGVLRDRGEWTRECTSSRVQSSEPAMGTHPGLIVLENIDPRNLPKPLPHEQPVPASKNPRRVMLLTGASRGIGHATVKRFSAAGFRVI